MRARTKALQISPKVKNAVWERDGHCCVYCGNPYAAPNAHYISRGQGGLGIAENIVTLCHDCHRAYDQSDKRGLYALVIGDYLRSKYPSWNEVNLYCKKVK